jgi:hypothetical protein
MAANPPEKVHLIPDDYHIERVGRFPDGKLIYQETQLWYDGNDTRDFVVSYVFDMDGNLIDDVVTLVGVRGRYAKDAMATARSQHEEMYGDFEITDIWVKPFSINRHDLVFGLLAERPYDDEDEVEFEDGDDGWRVTAMPGNTLQFYAPWDEGLYDT